MARTAEHDASIRDTSIRAYESKRDFAVTREPRPARRHTAGHAPIFVVQKHQARRAGLHWDFRLEHNGVLLSWAVRKGPSLDPADKRIAVHVEDHPLDYADFEGSIAEGYGAGEVEVWDRGTWKPLGDPEQGMRDGEIRFLLSGSRLRGRFTLVRMRPRPNVRGGQDNWLLIKGHDVEERPGMDAAALEAETPAPARSDAPSDSPPAQGAVRRRMPKTQAPQLATVSDEVPEGEDWLTEIKFDGYRLLVFIEDGTVRVITRNGQDWSARLPAVAAAVRRLPAASAILDGELVSLDLNGVSSFARLQADLAAGRDERLFFYVFDLLHLNGWDLRGCPLRSRKQVLRGLDHWGGMLRYSDHHDGDTVRMRQAACRMKLEGIICKRADAPYQAGRGHDWLKVKCQGREEFVILGWTEPAGSRTGLGALHLGYYDPDGGLHYAGGCGTGFSDETLVELRARLARLASAPPGSLILAGEDPERGIHWVRPELVAETSFISWTGYGRVRQAVFLGLREDKAARDVVRAPAEPDAERRIIAARSSGTRRGPRRAEPPPPDEATTKPARRSARIVTARAPKAGTETIEGVTLTHPDRELWPGISKRDLAAYWQSVAGWALPGLIHRPLAILRCPEGVAGEHFFQKHAHGAMPPGVREGSADKQPYLVIDGLQGLVAMAQMSAIELHAWGATEADPRHADQLVFDLDPGEGVTMPAIAAAAADLRDRLAALGLAGFCRTSGGKGLHVVVPLRPEQPWDTVRAFCKRFAEDVSAQAPDRYLSHVKIADRSGRILIDWLRNGIGATAVASFCPRARPGAHVATPLSWQEVTPALDPATFTVQTVPARLSKLKADPWEGFNDARRPLPALPEAPKRRAAGRARIVTTKAPRPRGRR
ncbi:MAG TPA: DNA ligase D [Rhodopila sp.]|nr:DNA ligase D [Rhodopila sp.]